ncbi:MAG: YbhB/YbcL family Raf kinase inhibitor-like protein [Rickettsiales bacterium]|nr:YbhB/YbcL family Raf kinase inhibitor-like protein [Rickettsiales bacterium]
MRLSMPAATFAAALLLAPAAHAQKTKDVNLQRHQPTSKSGMRAAIEEGHAKKRGKHPTYADEKAKAADSKLSAFTLNLGGVKNGGFIPPRFAYCTANGSGGTKDGPNLNPAMRWSPPPPGSKSLALLVTDPDVPQDFSKANVPGERIEADAPRRMFYHWVLVDIPIHVGGLLEGIDSKGITPGGNDWGTKAYGTNGQNDYASISPGPHGGYEGPCPPWNDARVHRYHFTLYALDIPSLKLPSPVTGPQAEVAMRGHILAQSEVVASFSTNKQLQQATGRVRRHAPPPPTPQPRSKSK